MREEMEQQLQEVIKVFRQRQDPRDLVRAMYDYGQFLHDQTSYYIRDIITLQMTICGYFEQSRLDEMMTGFADNYFAVRTLKYFIAAWHLHYERASAAVHRLPESTCVFFEYIRYAVYVLGALYGRVQKPEIEKQFGCLIADNYSDRLERELFKQANNYDPDALRTIKSLTKICDSYVNHIANVGKQVTKHQRLLLEQKRKAIVVLHEIVHKDDQLATIKIQLFSESFLRVRNVLAEQRNPTIMRLVNGIVDVLSLGVRSRYRKGSFCFWQSHGEVSVRRAERLLHLDQKSLDQALLDLHDCVFK